VLDQRQNHQFSAAFLEFAIKNASVEVFHSKILLYETTDVNTS
jgi:hypothetical protein